MQRIKTKHPTAWAIISGNDAKASVSAFAIVSYNVILFSVRPISWAEEYIIPKCQSNKIQLVALLEAYSKTTCSPRNKERKRCKCSGHRICFDDIFSVTDKEAKVLPVSYT